MQFSISIATQCLHKVARFKDAPTFFLDRQWLERRFLASDSISVVFDFLTVEGFPSDDFKVLSSWPRRDVSTIETTDVYNQGMLKGTVDLLFDWFGLVCFANKNKKMSVVIELIPNQSDRRSMVQ